MSFLQVTGVSKQQPGAFVLRDINFAQQKFQKIAIAGETGSGKTTLMKVIAGLMHADNGHILFENSRVLGPDERLIPGQPGIAYLSQHYELRNNYRVEELLEYANKLPGSDAQTLFALCRIGHLVKRKVDQLSGGEKQRIALARLLVGSPRLLLLDEPFSNLDPVHKNILKSVLKDVAEKLSITCLLASHDPSDTLSWADEILVLKDGVLVQKDAPQKIYHEPVTEYVAGLFGTYHLLTQQDLAQFSGSVPQLNGKRLFVRPEDIIIVPLSTSVLPQIITNISFWGSYSELEIVLNGKPITVRVMENGFGIGDSVGLGIGGKLRAMSYEL